MIIPHQSHPISPRAPTDLGHPFTSKEFLIGHPKQGGSGNHIFFRFQGTLKVICMAAEQISNKHAMQASRVPDPVRPPHVEQGAPGGEKGPPNPGLARLTAGWEVRCSPAIHSPRGGKRDTGSGTSVEDAVVWTGGGGERPWIASAARRRGRQIGANNCTKQKGGVRRNEQSDLYGTNLGIPLLGG